MEEGGPQDKHPKFRIRYWNTNLNFSTEAAKSPLFSEKLREIFGSKQIKTEAKGRGE